MSEHQCVSISIKFGYEVISFPQNWNIGAI